MSILSNPSYAFTNHALGIGVAGYSENFLGETTSSPTGAPQFFGEFDLPFVVSFDQAMPRGWFISPQLGYTAFSRVTPGDTGKVVISFASLRFGKNFSSQKRNGWDWYFGPGVMQHHFVGAGGTVQMNNGTGTAVFAVPGGTTDAKMWTTTVGTSLTLGASRFGVDFVIENIFMGEKRTQNLLLSYTYLLK